MNPQNRRGKHEVDARSLEKKNKRIDVEREDEDSLKMKHQEPPDVD